MYFNPKDDSITTELTDITLIKDKSIKTKSSPRARQSRLDLSFPQAKRACLPAGRSGIGIQKRQTADSGQASSRPDGAAGMTV